ncbi:MAG: permease [Acidobacteriota bacterium]
MKRTIKIFKALSDPNRLRIMLLLLQRQLCVCEITAVLVFINWEKSSPELKFWYFIYQAKWYIGAVLLAVLAWMIITWFKREELKEWTFSTWVFAKQIFPLLFAGVLVAGFLLGRPGHEGLIPSEWVAGLVGGNSLGANLFAFVAGALMYFATPAMVINGKVKASGRIPSPEEIKKWIREEA